MKGMKSHDYHGQNAKYVASTHVTPYDKGLQNGIYLFI
jgi:hypothetical protein